MNARKLKTILTYPIRRYCSCMVAVTNRCNARCDFCSIPMQSNNGITSGASFERSIKRLYELGVRLIQFTGGEPLLYRQLTRIVKYADELGMLTTIVTNGSLLDEKQTRALAESGILAISISVDHHDSNIFEQNRGIPGLADRIAKGVNYSQENGLLVQASTTISRLLRLEKDDYRHLVEKNRELGFDSTYFCYPMAEMASNYGLGGKIVEFEPDELKEIILHIRAMKKGGYPIDNSYETLDVVLSFLDGKPSKYPCLAGHKVFYLDWDLNLYDCMTQGNLIGPILDLDTKQLDLPRVECEKCVLACDREPSIYHHGTRSVVPFLRLVSTLSAGGFHRNAL